VCICVDVGPQAAQSATDWQAVLQRLLATRMIHNRPHLEVAIIAYGSNNTSNTLWSEERPDDYAGVDVVSVWLLLVCCCCLSFGNDVELRPEKTCPSKELYFVIMHKLTQSPAVGLWPRGTAA
jgi:hypothetical protein